LFLTKSFNHNKDEHQGLKSVYYLKGSFCMQYRFVKHHFGKIGDKSANTRKIDSAGFVMILKNGNNNVLKAVLKIHINRIGLASDFLTNKLKEGMWFVL